MVCDANLVGETKVVRTFVSTKLGSLVSDFRLTHLGVEQVNSFYRFPWQPGDHKLTLQADAKELGPVALRPTFSSGLLLTGEQG
jgi:hypothetical protein